MGIRATCPNGHELHLKSFLAGKKGICPKCGAKFRIPENAPDDGTEPESARPESAQPEAKQPASAAPRRAAQAGLGGAFEEPIDDLLHGKAGGEAMLTSTRVEKQTAKPTATRVVPPKTATAAPADVLAQEPAAAWYVQLVAGERFGPAQAPEMQAWLDQGRVPIDALVWRQGWNDWKPAGTIFSGLPATAAAGGIASHVPASATATVIQTEEAVAVSSATVKRRLARRFERSLTSVVVLGVIVAALAVVLAIVVMRGG